MEIKGYQNVIKELRSFGKDAERDIMAETEASARDIEKDAINKVVVDTGKLKQSITADKISELTWSVYVGGVAQSYAPFVEYGTGGLVDVPNEMIDNAIQFKGAGIRKINLPARPFLYPAFVKGRKEYVKNLKKLLKKYSNVKQS